MATVDTNNVNSTDVVARRGSILYKTNPFVANLTSKTKRIVNKKGDMTLVHSDTGEVQQSIAGFWHAEEVDATQFVKLYIGGVRALAELSNAGTKVFELLYLKVQGCIGCQQIILSIFDVEALSVPMSKRTFDRGLKELSDKGFVALSTTPRVYWVNPNYMWNGDRLSFVRGYVKKKGSELDHKKFPKVAGLL